MTLSSSPARWIVLVLVSLMVVGTLLFILIRTHRLQTSIESGQFEENYASAINALRSQTAEVRQKMRSNIPGDIEILSEEMLNALRASHDASPITETTAFENLRLSGIYLNDTTPLAEINGQLCQNGDPIGKFTIEKIEAYQITLRDSEGTLKTLYLIQEETP
ncbi:MAG: hypothetical protein ISR84_06280 [Kiritimatiellales bacterium]|nr:hypothetical protein [Kiritimatiellales bacterium]